MYQGTLLMRRLENVRAEFSLTALAYNIKRAITLVGVAGLIAVVRAWQPHCAHLLNQIWMPRCPTVRGGW